MNDASVAEPGSFTAYRIENRPFIEVDDGFLIELDVERLNELYDFGDMITNTNESVTESSNYVYSVSCFHY